MPPSIPKNILSFAGVCTLAESRRPGFGVAEAARRLRRFVFFLEQLLHLAAAHLNSTPEWENKSALALHAWLDAEHATLLRRRILELRQNAAVLTESPDPALATLFAEARQSRGSLELLTACFGVLRPALLRGVADYLDATNPLADHPSCRALKIIAAEQREILAWGRAALAACTASSAFRRESRTWAVHLQKFLDYAGGVDGQSPARATAAPPRRRSRAARHTDITPRRDSRFSGLFDTSTPSDTVYLDDSRPSAERNLALMFKRLREMDVPEVVAGILAQTPGKPWEYYAEMSRQMWDEARHALLGEAALRRRHFEGRVEWSALPVNVTFSWKLAKFCSPLERHILLYAIEQSLMPARRGKRYEWQLARAAGDSLMDVFQDFDWADEVLHVAIARRQLQDSLPGGLNEARRRSDRLWKRIARRLEKNPMPASAPMHAWWETFVQQALGERPTPVPETHVKDWRPLSA